jgi:RHS repeat-associated protein
VIESTDAGGATNGKDKHRRRVTDKYIDEASGLAYFGARYYDNILMGWTQGDPLYRFKPDAAWIDPRKANLYKYVIGNPVRFTDPDGREVRCNSWNDGSLTCYSEGDAFDSPSVDASGRSNYWSSSFWQHGVSGLPNRLESGAKATKGAVVTAGTAVVAVIVTVKKGAEKVADVVDAVLGDDEPSSSTPVKTFDGASEMLGSNGTQFTSKTIWNKGSQRLDVENPNPGKRAGQLHFQDKKGDKPKYLFDFETKKFKNAPNSVNKLLSDEQIQKAINKGAKMLGIDAPF